MSIFILSLSPLSNFRPELLLLAAQAEVSHLSAQECCKHYRNNSENDKKMPPIKIYTSGFIHTVIHVYREVSFHQEIREKFQIFWDHLNYDVIARDTRTNGVIDLMRRFTFAIPPVDGEASAQCTGHRRTLCHSTSRFMGKAFGS